MSTITKERIELFIKSPLENGLTRGEQMELARIALASLEAEPVAYIFKHPAGKLFWALTDESNKDQSDVIPVYAAAPASVVPDNASEPLAYAYKELTPEIMRNHLAVFERYGIAPNDSSTTIQALRIALDGIERSGAMLQGVEPASNHEELSEENGSSLQLRNLIRQRHAEWSDKTFGCVGPVGPLKHLSKEALEAAAEPDDLSEWADMQFLLWDAQRRAGISDAEITAAMEDKLKINMERQWPEPKDGEPRLHIKEPDNSPVTPDGWISCSERMPEKGQNVLISVNFDSSLVEPLICSARYTGSTFRRGDATIKPGNGIEQATHWMPLPEPPQEVK